VVVDLFIVIILPLLGALLFTAQLPQEIYQNYVLPIILAVLVVMVPIMIRNWLRDRARRKDKVSQRDLSRDELDKARSKLVKGQVRKSL
jgi:hypothetical protein